MKLKGRLEVDGRIALDESLDVMGKLLSNVPIIYLPKDEERSKGVFRNFSLNSLTAIFIVHEILVPYL